MDQATLQAQFLQMAASMDAGSNHQVLVRNSLSGCNPYIPPGLANLTAPPLSSPPPQFATQGPLPALSDATAFTPGITDPPRARTPFRWKRLSRSLRP